jgi:hypothetical protein
MFRKRAGPLVVFVHVPKTAGSTVNRHLRAWSRHGIDHAERYLETPEKLVRRLARLDWISGHVALNRFQALLGDTGRELRFFGLMRAPDRQVASQYNWQIEIFHRGRRFYNAHPPNIRAISDRIRATDNTDPAAIIANLKADPGLFLNLQTRFLLGDDIDLESPEAARRVRLYEMIAPAPAPLLQRITGRSLPEAIRENASAYHVDADLFDHAPLSTFLAQDNQHDIRLYRQIRDAAEAG